MKIQTLLTTLVISLPLSADVVKPLKAKLSEWAFEELGITEGSTLKLQHSQIGGLLKVGASPANLIRITKEEWNEYEPNGFLSYDEDDQTLSYIPEMGPLDSDFHWEVPASTIIELHNVDGEIEVEGIVSEISVTTVDGDLDLISVGGPIVVEVFDGNVTIDLSPEHTDANILVSAVDGDIELNSQIPLNGQFSANTIDGEIDCNQPMVLSNHDGGFIRLSHGESLSGTLGKGGPLIRLNVVDGDIDVTVASLD
jgi:hypothetical protein